MIKIFFHLIFLKFAHKLNHNGQKFKLLSIMMNKNGKNKRCLVNAKKRTRLDYNDYLTININLQ